MKITLSFEEKDLKNILQALRNQAVELTIAAQQKRLQKIIDQIIISADLEEKIFEKVKIFLDPKTNAKITKESDLRHDLSISDTWLANSLYNQCNTLVTELLSDFNPPKNAEKIKKAKAAACISVQDIVDLIKTTYESAK